MSTSNDVLVASARKTILGIAATVAAVGLVVLLLTWFQSSDDTVQDGPSARAVREEVDAAAAERLAGYGWVDKAKGIVHIPVDRAIELVLRDRAAGGDDDG